MNRPNKEIIIQLSKHSTANSVTIYLATHRPGTDYSGDKNRIKLKNQIKEVKRTLMQRGMSENEVKNYLQPLYELEQNTIFLNNLWDGLVVFLSEDTYEYYVMSEIFDDLVYVGEEFYLIPLLKPLSENRDFYLLSLALQGVTLYKANRFSIEKLDVEDFLPQNVENAIGFDYKNRIFQHRAARTSDGQTLYQGHVRGEEERKEDIRKFLRYIDKGLNKVLKGEDKPLIVASVDYIFSFFKEITSYKNLHEQNISESPENEKPEALQVRAWEYIKERINKDIEKAMKEFDETKNKSFVIENIIPNVPLGRIKTLFVNKDEHVWGLYLQSENKAEIHEKKGTDDMELVNWAAIHTYLTKGNVYLLEPDEMPVPNRALNAIYRY